ncbi:hypothetical protein C8Q79DRAFT_1007388 [Trametes meyenii]|nr:hypothetical protein C8Q79DRAFT_1007388 [Trametes meyenii]
MTVQSALNTTSLSGAEVAEAASALPGTIGAFTVGTFVSLVLYGISILQFYRYLRTHPDDNVNIKALVLSAMLLSTVHTVMSMHTCYYYLVSNYFSPGVLMRSVWSSDLLPLVHFFVTMVSQAFFARRVYLIGTRYKFIAIFAFLCLFAGLAESIYIAYQGLSLNILLITLPSAQLNTPVSLGLSALADIVLSGAIMVSLRHNRDSRASLSGFDLVVLYVLNTGLLTGIVHAFACIAASAWTTKLYWGAIALVGVKLYLITLFSVLNSRTMLHSRGITVFNDGKQYGRSIFTHAHQRTVVEQWNVPRVVTDDLPAMIDIEVSQELQIHKDHDLKRIATSDS